MMVVHCNWLLTPLHVADSIDFRFGTNKSGWNKLEIVQLFVEKIYIWYFATQVTLATTNYSLTVYGHVRIMQQERRAGSSIFNSLEISKSKSFQKIVSLHSCFPPCSMCIIWKFHASSYCVFIRFFPKFNFDNDRYNKIIAAYHNAAVRTLT